MIGPERGKGLFLAELGLRVAIQRQAKGWSQEKLAQKIKRTRTHLCNIERGATSMPVEQVDVIAKALGVSIMKLWPRGVA